MLITGCNLMFNICFLLGSFIQCLQLLECLGVPWVQAAGEAEAMCAYLNAKGHVDGCITNDGDVFLYGAQTVYRNFAMNSKVMYISRVRRGSCWLFRVFPKMYVEIKRKPLKQLLGYHAYLLVCVYFNYPLSQEHFAHVVGLRAKQLKVTYCTIIYVCGVP